MPAEPQGIYEEGRGRWYLKVTLGRDPLTGMRVRITSVVFGRPLKRAGRDAPAKIDTGQVRPRRVSGGGRPSAPELAGIDALPPTWTTTFHVPSSVGCALSVAPSRACRCRTSTCI